MQQVRSGSGDNPHGENVQPDGKCPPELNFMQGYCVECCGKRKYMGRVKTELPPKIAFIEAAFSLLIISAETLKKKRFMMLHVRAKELEREATPLC